MDGADERKMLEMAIKNGDLQAVEHLLENGVSCNGDDISNSSPLHVAVCAGNLSIVDVLLDAGADINCSRVEDLVTPLHLAVQMNQVEIVKRLLAVPGIQVDAQMRNTFTALHIACQHGHRDVVLALLARGADMEATSEPALTTPLFLAIIFSHYSVFEILVDAGADLSTVDKKKSNLLHAATIDGHFIEIGRLLLQRSVDVNQRDNLNMTPLHIAAVSGNVKFAALFLENGAEVDAQDCSYMTALHYTATILDSTSAPGIISIGSNFGRTRVARLLIQHGAQVNMADVEGRTPLHFAASNQQLHLMRVLMDEGKADVNAVDGSGVSALYCAAPICGPDVIKGLLTRGCYYDVIVNNGETTEDFAMKNSDVSVLALFNLVNRFFNAITNADDVVVRQCLFEWNGLVMCRSKRFMSPLHIPAINGFTQMVELLLEHGANCDSSNDVYASPIHLASRFNNYDVVMALLIKGANFKAICKMQGWTALSYAEYNKNACIISLLRSISNLFRDTENGHPRVIPYLKFQKAQYPDFYQAIINGRNNEEQNLLDVAREHHRNDIVAFLV